MKKIKIMLLSFALLAIVGGALAFKARFSASFCYTTLNGAANCLNKVCGISYYTQAVDVAQPANKPFCSTITNGIANDDPCTEIVQGVETTLKCPNLTSITGDAGGAPVANAR